MEGFDLVALGSLSRELLVYADRFPAAGDAIRASSEWTSGGMAGNLAHAVARLGGRVAMVSAIGADLAGDDVVQQLAGAGVYTEFVFRRPNLPSPTVILIVNPDLQRAGLVLDEATHLTLQPEEVPDELLLASRVFFTDLTPPVASLALSERAHRLGRPVAFDMQMAMSHVNLTGYNEYIGQMFAMADYYFADRENFMLWRGEMNFERALAMAQSERPETCFVITQGGQGALIAWRQKRVHVPAFPVQVADTIGAGDAFHGAFLYGHLSLGWELESVGRFASAVAALSCTRAGARAGLPDFPAVKAFLKSCGTALPDLL